jgi:lambda repressor-like predicted transcriptional regulator
MKHRGEIVSKLVYQKGWSKVKLAEELGINRQTLYNQLDKAEMKLPYIIKIGKLLDVDFLELIPDLKKEYEELQKFPDLHEDFEVQAIEPIEMMISLDGTQETLTRLFRRLTAINNSLRLD